MPIDVYDMSSFYIPDLYYEILEKVDFLKDLKDNSTFLVPNTDIYLLVSYGGCVWYELASDDNACGKEISLEDVIDKIPEELQTKFLFHLDVFTKEPPSRYNKFKGIK